MAAVFGDRPKSSEIFWPGEKDERRAEGDGGDCEGELSLDMMDLDECSGTITQLMLQLESVKALRLRQKGSSFLFC